MPNRLFLLFIVAVFHTPTSPAAPVDFVVDLDGVLLYTVDRSIVGTDFKILAQSYRLAHGAAEFVESLTSVPGARVSFFSTGSETRNLEALSQIRLPSGKTARQIAYRIFSKQHLTNAKKDLAVLGPDFDPERTVLIDDWHWHTSTGQERNLLLVTPSQPMYDADLDLAVNIPESEFERESTRNWTHELFLERNKLVRAAGLVDLAVAHAQFDRISLTLALNDLQWDSHGRYRYLETNSDRILLRGKSLLQRFNSKIDLFRPKSCEETLTSQAGSSRD